MAPAKQTTHAVIHLAVDAPDAMTLPVIVELDDPHHPRVSFAAASYARYLQREGHASYETIQKSIQAIGKLRDFYLLVQAGEPLRSGDFRNLLERFLHAVQHGSVLGWKSASRNQVAIARAAVADFVSFVATHSEGWPLGESEQQFLNDCRRAYASAAHADKSLLFHIKKTTSQERRGRGNVIVGLHQYKPFPPHLVDQLIQDTPNVRDKLLFAMCAFGGRRLSEYLHLFHQDVHVQGEELQVQLFHPSDSPMSWRNLSGNAIKATRREYLKSMFNLRPRTAHGAVSSHVGWKGIKFDDLKNRSSSVYFIRSAARQMALLHRQYLHEHLPRVAQGKHPYYFASENGVPLTIKAAEKQFQLARTRLEKKQGISLSGYGLHSLRHYYGFFHADVLRTDLLLLRQYMGHAQLSSTAIYAHISASTAQKALEEAELRAKHDDRPPTEHDKEARDPSLFSHALTSRFQLNLAQHGTSIYGELDTQRATRRLR